MDPIPITDAKDIATRRRCRGVLVIAFGGGSFRTVSYGHTRATCDAMRRVNDRVADLIEAGEIEIDSSLCGDA